MRLTGKQAHVLDRLERVEARLPSLRHVDRRTRFYVDGWECTPQITSLVVKKLVAHVGAGDLVRLPIRLSALADPGSTGRIGSGSHLFGVGDRGDIVGIGGAAAKVAAHELADVAQS